jgi:hypothetical protein
LTHSSHAWAGVVGILDIKDHIAKSTRTQNDFAAWREATPKHNELVDTILKSSLHLIVTLRTKTGYEIAQDDKGKTRVQKLGLAFVQREGLEYECCHRWRMDPGCGENWTHSVVAVA